MVALKRLVDILAARLSGVAVSRNLCGREPQSHEAFSELVCASEGAGRGAGDAVLSRVRGAADGVSAVRGPLATGRGDWSSDEEAALH